MRKIVLSNLKHTWIIDLDGTIVTHNGHLHGEDVLLPGVNEFWANIPANDKIMVMSARAESLRAQTEAFLMGCKLRFDYLVLGLPTGERILLNDTKPSGLNTAIAVNIVRDVGLQELSLEIDQSL